MNVVAIIQARMGSTRLPGKVLLPLGNHSMLEWVVTRTRQATMVCNVWVATTTQAEDDAIAVACQQMDVAVFRGNEMDVLDRYYNAAATAQADVIIRITADCPFIDPEIIDQIVTVFQQQHPDYISNTLERSYPRGLDTELFTAEVLTQAWHEAQEPFQRVHVTPFFYQNPSRFRLLSVRDTEDHSQHRWTVDTPDDLNFARQMAAHSPNTMSFSWRELLAVVTKNPELLKLNQHIRQKSLREG